jgi:rhamnosyltransferase
MKTIGVVVAYFPNLEQLIFNIESYANDLDKLIIWNNTPNQSEACFHSLKSRYADKILIMGNGKNEGIGYALNRAAEWGITNNYDYLLTMDQDSYFDKNSMTRYIKLIQNNDSEGILAYASMLHLISGDTPPFEGIFRAMKLCITSGTVYPLEVFRKIGFFQEELFIEGIDFELCWRAEKYHLKTLLVNQVYLNHSVGNRKEHRLLGLKVHTYNYAPVRLYYSVRNITYLYKKYKDHGYMKSYIYHNMFKRSIAIILLEKDKRKKLNAMLLGFIHGLKGKLGVFSG